MSTADEKKPKFFIGSTGRAYEYVDALVRACESISKDAEFKKRFSNGFPLTPVPWKDVFGDPKRTETSFLDIVARQSYECSYGVFFYTPEDGIDKGAYAKKKPAKKKVTNAVNPDLYVVRDNVIFETGLFIGARGRNNALVVINRNDFAKLELPSDFVGAVSEHFNLGQPESGKTNCDEFLRLARMIADRWQAQQFVLEHGTSKVIRKREDCYQAGIQIVRSAFCRVATLLSYPGEVSDPKSKSTPAWKRDGSIEKNLFDTICEKAVERGVKVYRWMNLGVADISAQAEELMKLFEKHGLKNELFIKDTYCEFIEIMVADDYVLIVLPAATVRSETDVEVGVGLMIRNRDIANYFFDWFEKRLPLPGQKAFTKFDELQQYVTKRVVPPWTQSSTRVTAARKKKAAKKRRSS